MVKLTRVDMMCLFLPNSTSSGMWFLIWCMRIDTGCLAIEKSRVKTYTKDCELLLFHVGVRSWFLWSEWDGWLWFQWFQVLVVWYWRMVRNLSDFYFSSCHIHGAPTCTALPDLGSLGNINVRQVNEANCTSVRVTCRFRLSAYDFLVAWLYASIQ